MTDIEQLRTAIQSGFDLLDVRLLPIEAMAAACRKASEACKWKEVAGNEQPQ